jgi:hypothetical protein
VQAHRFSSVADPAAVHEMHKLVLSDDATQVAVVGGKGAHLGELSRIDGIRVPPGFCVTTGAFRRIMRAAPPIDDRLDRLSRLDADDREAIRTLWRSAGSSKRSRSQTIWRRRSPGRLLVFKGGTGEGDEMRRSWRAMVALRDVA